MALVVPLEHVLLSDKSEDRYCLVKHNVNLVISFLLIKMCQYYGAKRNI